MVFIKRDENNAIKAIFAQDENPSLESVSSNDPAVMTFLAKCELEQQATFVKADLELIRVIEDLIQILMAKNILSITDFPLPVINKLVLRGKIRDQFNSVSGLMNETDETL